MIDVIVGDTYEHRKGGRYVVVALARIEADLSPVVVYRAEYDNTVWVRPLDQFADGRFKHVPEADWNAAMAAGASGTL